MPDARFEEEGVGDLSYESLTRSPFRVVTLFRRIMIGGGALAIAGAATVAVSLASASQYSGSAAVADHAVFVQGNELDGNSIAVHGKVAYVMNAGGAGSVQGFKITDKGLEPLAGSHRSLGLDNEGIPLFSSSPGEVDFTPDGRNLVVTTKSNNTVEVFPMSRNGLLAVAEPVINTSAGGVPFAISFDGTGKPTARRPCAGWSAPATTPTAATPGTPPPPATAWTRTAGSP